MRKIQVRTDRTPPLFMRGNRRGARNRAAVRAGGNGGAAAACGSAAGDDRYGAGMGVPATHGDFDLAFEVGFVS